MSDIRRRRRRRRQQLFCKTFLSSRHISVLIFLHFFFLCISDPCTYLSIGKKETAATLLQNFSFLLTLSPAHFLLFCLISFQSCIFLHQLFFYFCNASTSISHVCRIFMSINSNLIWFNLLTARLKSITLLKLSIHIRRCASTGSNAFGW